MASTSQDKDKGKRLASESPDREDLESSPNAGKLQHWLVVTMYNAAMFTVLGSILDGSLTEGPNSRNFAAVRNCMEHHWFESGPAALKLLRSVASSTDEPYTRFGLKDHEHLLRDGTLARSPNERLRDYSERFAKDYADRQEVLLQVAGICAAMASTQQATITGSEAQSSATGKSAKKAKTERLTIYQTPKPRAGTTKTVKIDNSKLEIAFREHTLTDCLKRMQLLLLARLIATSLVNSGSASAVVVTTSAPAPAGKGKASASKTDVRNDLDALFPPTEPTTNLFSISFDEVLRVLRKYIRSADNTFEPFGEDAEKEEAMERIRDMSNTSWVPQKGFGDKLYECSLNMVYALPQLQPDLEEGIEVPDLSDSDPESDL